MYEREETVGNSRFDKCSCVDLYARAHSADVLQIEIKIIFTGTQVVFYKYINT